MSRKKVENLVKGGLGENIFFRDLMGRTVEVEFIGTRTYRREEVSKPWGEIGEKVPRRANARFIDCIERTVEGVFYYTIEYYKILGRR